MITMIRTVWKLLQVTAACLITMLLLSLAIPKYLEWRESNPVPTVVIRVEEALFHAVAWSRERLGNTPTAPKAVNPVYLRTSDSPPRFLEGPSPREPVGPSSHQSRYERNLKAISTLQEKLYEK